MRRKAAKVKPLKRREDVNKVAEYLRSNYHNGEMLRLLFLTGCNTGLRACDVRKITHTQLASKSFEVCERKTQKIRTVFVNPTLQKLYLGYVGGYEKIIFSKRAEIRTRTVIMVRDDIPIFRGIQGGDGFSVKYIHFVIKDACRKLGIRGNYGSHTMRKTFAYHAYMLCRDLERVQAILRHSDIRVTEKYIERLVDTSGTIVECLMTDEEIYDVALE